MSYRAQASGGQFRPALRAALGCWRAARGFAEHRALAGYIAQRAFDRAGLGFDEHVPRTIRLDGLELSVRPGSGELALYQEMFLDRVYERDPTFALRPGWCVLDCGANIGMFSLRAARAGCAKVVALEPDPETFARLDLNLERNGAAAVTALQSAVWRTSGREAFQRSGVSTLGRMVSQEQSAVAAGFGIAVEATTIADLFARFALRTVHLLKLDIEGAECEALEGARPVLDRIERIVMEYHGAERLAACEGLLREYGFARAALAAPSYAYFAREWAC